MGVTTHPDLSIEATDLAAGRIYMQVEYFSDDGRRIKDVDTAACSIVNQAAGVLEQVTREAMKGMLH